MLHSLKTLDGFSLAATDGEIGRVRDVLFDDEKWTVRYFEVDTGGWLSGRNVLLSPVSVKAIDWHGERLLLDLTRSQVENSPGLDAAVPVSRQHELALSRHYGLPYYWSGPYLWGYTALPLLVDPIPWNASTDQWAGQPVDEALADGDPHLRGKDEVLGYAIEAEDGAMGHVEDFLFDEASWRIGLMVIDTRDWWPGRHVLVPPERIVSVSWEEKSVRVRATRAELEDAPEYDSRRPPQPGETSRTWQRQASPAYSETDPRQDWGHSQRRQPREGEGWR